MGEDNSGQHDEVRPRDSRAPLGGLARARLVFTTGTTQLHITGDAATADLYRARSDYRSDVRVEGDTIRIAYHKYGVLDMFRSFKPPTASVALNQAVRWAIAFEATATELEADLTGLQLAALRAKGAVAESGIALGQPQGTVRITLAGGAQNLNLVRPAGVELRLGVRGKCENVRLDGRLLVAALFRRSWQTPGYDNAANRYDVEIKGGANGLNITSRK